MTPHRSQAGFSLVEALVATALMGLVLTGLTLITSQWMPNWQRGLSRVQASEALGLAVDRMAADLAAAEFVPENREAKRPMFEGTETGVTFVRSALAPNDPPGLQIVRLADTGTLTRSAMAYVPLRPEARAPAPGEPVELLPATYRVLFSFAGRDGVWRSAWRDQDMLPRAVRIVVRDARSGRTFAASTAAVIRAEIPAGCIADESREGCGPGRQENAQGETP
ncbi:PulJ/GspJ family protein [Terrihabitans rhizophilus]|uniref:Prepilin-type N-terminal cleavage/methylation domain-containing protein n=1 Tax=Terrihabitans rhizophilus TaxID=3092662 RepID=A0ABU4RM72_9HYPH|nr:prepilin-type N-terminal cleavage/methylation domain-containing protein [Terrihabitans sp. PJ23]MDX6805925.1 prepilin-type N-terminal cleavage/methylation domain-containing protein [Terrihabitans sp. PJ23]